MTSIVIIVDCFKVVFFNWSAQLETGERERVYGNASCDIYNMYANYWALNLKYIYYIINLF